MVIPKVSIVVPVYNVKFYLKRCINSILCQTMREIEVILVDDGSTDDSVQICHEYACEDDRVRVFHQKRIFFHFQKGGVGKLFYPVLFH